MCQKFAVKTSFRKEGATSCKEPACNTPSIPLHTWQDISHHPEMSFKPKTDKKKQTTDLPLTCVPEE